MLDCAREDPKDEKDALAARRPSLFRPRAPCTSISDHKDAAAGWSVSSRISSRAFSNSLLPHKPLLTGRHWKSGSQSSLHGFRQNAKTMKTSR